MLNLHGTWGICLVIGTVFSSSFGEVTQSIQKGLLGQQVLPPFFSFFFHIIGIGVQGNCATTNVH